MSDPAPMTLFDLDTAGLDPAKPCPPEFMQFIYDNSRAGYLTLWSSRMGEPDMPTRITQWLQEGLARYHARSIATQMAPLGAKPAGDHVTEVTYSGPTEMAPPVNRDVPYVSGTGEVGAVLNCTMGNWDGEPTLYAYKWKSTKAGAETDIAEGPDYVVMEKDAGSSITCRVTATNAGGSTVAPPSNAIAIPGAAADASAHTRSSSHTSSTTARHADERERDDTKVSRTASAQRATTRDT